MASYQNDLMDFAYSAERSIEDGIEDMSNAEMYTVIISYIVMFIYILFALGKFKGINTFLVIKITFKPFYNYQKKNALTFFYIQLDSKITLAVGGIAIVLISVVCSLGVFGYAGVATTMLTIEVIPFLVLAVGVDNIFILVHTLHRLDRSKYNSIGEHVGASLGLVGPSILLTSASEVFCFALGSLSEMPAVKTFAMYASVALLIDFILQTTAFIALIAIDQKRYEVCLFAFFLMSM